MTKAEMLIGSYTVLSVGVGSTELRPASAVKQMWEQRIDEGELLLSEVDVETLKEMQ